MSYHPPALFVQSFLVLKFPIYSGHIKNEDVYFVFVLNTMYEISQFAKNSVIQHRTVWYCRKLLTQSVFQTIIVQLKSLLTQNLSGLNK